MSCNLKIDLTKYKSLAALSQHCGTNNKLFNNYMLSVVEPINTMGELGFKQKFKNSWKNKEELSLITTDPITLKNAIIEYFNKEHLSSTATNRQLKGVDEVALFGYTNVEARNEGIVHFVDFMLRGYHFNKNLGKFKVEDNLRGEYIKFAINQFNNVLSKRLAKVSGENVDVIKAELDKINNSAYIDNLIADKEVNVQCQNLIALYREYSTTDFVSDNSIKNITGVSTYNPRAEFFKEVIRNKKLGEVRFDTEESIEDTLNKIFENEEFLLQHDIDPETLTPEYEADSYIQKLNQKEGIYVDFMTHLDASMRSLLGSVYRRITPTNDLGKASLDTDNYMGLPFCMDANTCASVLYHEQGFDNIDQMMNTIDRIAKCIPGFAGFEDLAKTLNDKPDIKIKFYNTFKKLSMTKSETTISDGAIKLKVSNLANNRQEYVHYKFLNSFKGSALDNSYDYNMKQYGVLQTKLQTYNPDEDVNGVEVREIADSFTEEYKRFFPWLDNMTVRNYVIINKNKGIDTVGENRKANLQQLLTTFNNLIIAAKETADNYYVKQSKINTAYRRNSELKLEAKRNKKTPKLIDLAPLWAEKYTSSKADGLCMTLSTLFADYIPLTQPCNSRNVEGNQSSDVLNDNMISFVIKTLQSRLNTYTEDEQGNKIWDEKSPIMRLAQQRSKSKQYNLSNILIEHEGVNKGIFKIDDNGNWVPTENAADILKISLYQGASNSDDQTNAAYDKMSHNDYLRSAWENFFSDKTQGNYFTRIPSDKPHIYNITAPKYSASGLLQEANRSKVDAEIDVLVKSIGSHQIEQTNDVVSIDKPMKISDNTSLKTKDFIEHLRSTVNNTVDIKLPKRIRYKFKTDKNKKVKLALRYASDEDSTSKDNVYIMEGVYYDGKLHNAHFVGFKSGSINGSMWAKFKDAIINEKRKMSVKDGGIAYKLNKKDPLYRQMYNVFQQEITDMLTAGSIMFKTIEKDGKHYFATDARKTITNPDKTSKTKRITNPNYGHPLLQNGWSNDYQNGLHPVYHFKDGDTKSDRKIYKVNKDNIDLLGNVFHSDRFIIYNDDNEVGINYGERIMHELFGVADTNDKQGFTNFFYGAANSLSFDVNPNGEYSIKFNEEQDAIIEKHLQDFVSNYIQEARNELENVYKTESDIKFDSIKLAEFALNNHLMYIAFNDLFEGDTKFYKNSQTFLKRAAEIQGAGVGFGMTDLTRPVDAEHTEINSPLDTITFFGGKKVQMYDSFSAVTIYNTIKTDNKMLDCIIDTLTDKTKMKNKALTVEEAKALMYGPVNDENGENEGGYQKTTVNDAQSYITFDEWIRRIAGRGQLNKYKPLIDNILNESKPLNINDIKEFIQIQKNFYYDLHYNDKTKVIGPRQIKNAEMVLVPRFIKGTELEKVAQMMNRLGIDQLNTVETSKASQSDRFTIWNDEGELTPEIRSDFEHLDDASYNDWKSELMNAMNTSKTREYYNYNNLYTQLEVSQHHGANAENKAGIQFMKKILDNIDENAPEHLQQLKKDFQNLYTANIKDSYETLMNKLGIDVNNFKFDVNDNQIIGLDKTKLYDLALEQLIKQGLDSNALDYCEIDPNSITGDPIMPNCTSIFGTKFENVFQSIFNKNITRQTLPGFHAAQATSVGFNKFNLHDENVKQSNNLKYHIEIDDKGNYTYVEHIEIMVAPSVLGVDIHSDYYKNKTKEEILAELEEKGLNVLIGYRIPTEGKQSVCYMKVVDFIDDAQGSTIIVPDAWVSQTGADMDGDSVYGIQHKVYIASDGRVFKPEYKESFDKYDWFKYINKNTQTKVDGITDELYNKAFEVAKKKADVLGKQRAEALKNMNNILNIVYKNIPKDLKDKIKEDTQIVRNTINILNDVSDIMDENLYKKAKYDAIINKFKTIASTIDSYIANNPNALDEYEDLKTYKDVIKDILDIKSKNYLTDELTKILDFIKDKQEEAYTQLAKENNLDDKTTWLSKANTNPLYYNSRDARTNKLVDTAIGILTDPYTLEENLSRSNFDSVSRALIKYNATNKIANNKRKARSPYNVFSQAWYQQDAMSGLKLKGISVVRDNLCSVMNNLKAEVQEDSSIKVKYTGNFDKTKLKNRFGNNVDFIYDKDGKTVIGCYVTHNKLGWSGDNKNIDDYIITSYSSQTTAHILDAMKYGNVPNVNDLTFQIYKTFVDMGSNYDTAVSFIMLPGISKIVEAYDETNSIYSKERSRDYVRKAIRMIADELNIDYDWNTTTEEILDEIEQSYGTVGRYMFGEGYMFSRSEYTNSLVAFDSNMNGMRIAEKGIFSGNNSSPVEELKKVLADDKDITVGEVKSLYDLYTILQYDKLSMLVDDIRSVAMVANPDKFGAKQTIYGTRQVLNNMIDCVKDTQVERNGETVTNFRIKQGNKHILDSLYPGIVNIVENAINTEDELIEYILNSEDFINKSDYKFLAAFIKYSTIPSIVVNSTMFPTQSPRFRSLIESKDFGLKGVCSYGRDINEKTAKDFQNYVINYITLNSSFLQAPLYYDMGKGGARGFAYVNKKPKQFNQEESDRIFGFGYPTSISYVDTVIDGDNSYQIEKPFVCTEMYHPTEDNQQELNNFAKLTPAQKVLWIQKNFLNETPLFDYVDVNIFDEYAIRTGKGCQTLSFRETGADIETVYREFELAYTNKNPYIAMAAADMIKYAFFVEGYKMGMGTISKMIKNSVLLHGGRIFGTNIMTELKENLRNLDNVIVENGEKLIENYVRGHYKQIGIEYHKVTYDKRNKTYDLAKQNNGLILLNSNLEENAKLAVKYGIAVDGKNPKDNKYVRLAFNGAETLYKIKTMPANGNVYWCLIPLNPLAANENKTWTSMDSTNDYYDSDFYDILLKSYFDKVEEEGLSSAIYHPEIMAKAEVANDYKNHKSPLQINKLNKTSIPIKDINSNPSFTELVKNIQNWYATSIEKNQPILYQFNSILGKYIKEEGPRGALTEAIYLPNNGIVNVTIGKLPIKKDMFNPTGYEEYINLYLGKNINREIATVHMKDKAIIDIMRYEAKHYPDMTISPYNHNIYYIKEIESDIVDNPDEINEQDKEKAIVERMSSKLDVAVQSGKAIMTNSNVDLTDKEATVFSNMIRDNNIVLDAQYLGDDTESVIIGASKYVKKHIDNLIELYNNYIKNPDGEGFLSINNSKTIQIIKANPKLRRKFFKDIQERNRVLRQFSLIKDLDISSETSYVEKYLKDFKQAISKLEDVSLVNDACEKMLKDYYDSISTDPLIKQGLMSVLDGYFKSNWANAMFNDIQEESNPIVQIVLKNFQADYRAKTDKAREEAKIFKKAINKLIIDARNAGTPINFDKFIDEYGKFKQLYNEQFLEDRDKLKKEHDLAIAMYGRGSVQELETRLKYNEWKEQNIEQPLVSKYYRKRNKLLREILYGHEYTDPQTRETSIVGRAPYALSLYETLNSKLRMERDKYKGDEENPDLDAKVDALDEEMHRLRYNRTADGSLKQDIDIDLDNASLAEKLNHARNDRRQAELLDNYLKTISAINRLYFKYTAAADFEDKVKSNLEIIAEYETSGEPIVTYANNERYKKAKTWLRQNASYRPIYTSKQESELETAKSVFTPTDKADLSLLYKVRHDKKYRNEDGRFDPRLLSKKDIEDLRNEQLESNRFYGDDLSERIILTNSPEEDVVYTEDFYRGLTGDQSIDRNIRWNKAVKKLNELLSPCYDADTKTIDLSKIPNTKEGIEKLKDIRKLYNSLKEIRKTGTQSVARFMKEYVDDSAINQDKYDADIRWMKGLPYSEYKTLIAQIVNLKAKGKFVPNHYLYGILKPKDKYLDRFTDKKKTKAIKILKKYYRYEIKPEYYAEKKKMYLRGNEEYNKWLDENTVYNPYTHAVEPLQVWQQRVQIADKYEYEPKFNQQVSNPRDGKFTDKEIYQEADYLPDEIETSDDYLKEYDFRNKKYNPIGSHALNFKYREDSPYKASLNLTSYEKEARDLMYNTLKQWTKTKEGNRWLDKGWLPAKAISSPRTLKGLGKELIKIVGITNETYDPNDWYENFDFSKDRERTMPMLSLLKGKGFAKKPERPIKKDYDDIAKFEADVKKWEQDCKAIDKANLEVHKNLLDRNWVESIQDFIIQAGAYNAIQDNKYELVFARDMLEKYGAYVTGYSKTGKTFYKKDYETGGKRSKNYIRTKDTNLIAQFDNQLKRILYNQYKASNNAKLINWLNTLQSLTSAQYMMFNFKGGIANVTLGEYSIIQETFAGTFFEKNHLYKGTTFYGSGIMDYIQYTMTGKTNTLPGAIIARMDVIDYDEHTGVVEETKDVYAAIRKFRNAAYTPQTAGEHEMQNRAMFAMMYSHRLVKREDTSNGETSWTFMNFSEFVRNEREKVLLTYLNKDLRDKYIKYKEDISKDADVFKEYAHRQKDTVSAFARARLSIEQQKELAQKLQQAENTAKTKFNDDALHPTIMSQLSLTDDNTMGFKQGSILDNMSMIKNEDGLDEATRFLGEFKGRVISVNKFIHGVYDKSGKAQFEKTWIGSLVMQYHKHLPMGIMKRYRSQGYYNEERGEVQKGMYRSLVDFLSIPFEKHKEVLGLSDEELLAANSLKSIMQQTVDFALNIDVAYNLLPDYEKANLRRLLCSSLEVLATVFATIALKAGWDDEDSLLYNMAIYQADRLATESAQYMPLTAWGEGRKLYQSPVAAGSGVTDLLSSMNMIAHMIMDGDEYDGEYHSGKFAGENKLSVYVQRRIPIWRGIKSSFIDVKDNNSFYKVSENMLGFFDADKRAKQLKEAFK